MKTYKVKGQSGQTDTARSITEAKRIARRMCIRNVGRSNMMTSGTFLAAPRLYWQTWCDGTIIGDPARRYDGNNPTVTIVAAEDPSHGEKD